MDYNEPVTTKGHNINNINQTDTAMITYIVTSTTESYQYTDGHVDSIIERGTAATLAAAKRKARKAAAEHGHHAEISYEEDGKYVLREVNTYGIEGDWVEFS